MWDNSEKSQTELTIEEYLALWDEMACVLHEMKKDSQPHSINIVQPILKCIIKPYVLEFIKPWHGGFNEIKKIVKIIHETIHMLNLSCDDHYCKQTSTILTCSRLDHGL
jgi:hypothetical protein